MKEDEEKEDNGNVDGTSSLQFGGPTRQRAPTTKDRRQPRGTSSSPKARSTAINDRAEVSSEADRRQAFQTKRSADDPETKEAGVGSNCISQFHSFVSRRDDEQDKQFRKEYDQFELHSPRKDEMRLTEDKNYPWNAGSSHKSSVATR